MFKIFSSSPRSKSKRDGSTSSGHKLSTHPPSWFEDLRKAKIIYQCGNRIVWVMENVYILKRTQYTINSEAATHRFITANTPIPCPRVFGEWLSRDRSQHFLLEERAGGVTLGQCWPQLSSEDKIYLAQQVADYMSKLARRFRGRRIESVSGQALPINCFVPDNSGSRGFLHGRWRTDDDIFDNEFLPALERTGLPSPIIKAVRATMPPCQGQLALTHCDLYVGNIMVDPDRAVVTAIIDWESAGYWPEWFQYARITHGCNPDDAQWKYVLSRVCRPLIPHADHGRVWLDMVHLFLSYPASLQARAWLRLLGSYLKGDISSGDMQDYRKLDGRHEHEYRAKEAARLNNKGLKGDQGYYSTCLRF